MNSFERHKAGVTPGVQLPPSEVETRSEAVPTPRSRDSRRDNKRAFAAAKIDNLTFSLKVQDVPFDQDILQGLRVMRARSREEYGSNEYAKRAVNLYKQNVIGPDGIKFMSRVRRGNGSPDKPAIAALERSWKQFCRRGNCEVTRKHSFRSVENMVTQSVLIDGEAFVVEVDNYRNDFGYAVQLMDPALLDHNLNVKLDNGNFIVMGVEIDEWKAPVAYHFLPAYPLNDHYATTTARSLNSYIRIPAARVLHIYNPEYVHQTRGVPALAVTLLRFNMTRGYEEAELVAARSASAKMGFFTTNEEGESFEGGEQNKDGSTIDAMTPGQIERLPKGVTFEGWDPQHPNGNQGGFIKTLLRASAAGVNVPYNQMANDGEGINFSTIRFFDRDAQDVWRSFQNLLIESLHSFVYEGWLRSVLKSGRVELRPGVPLAPAFIDKYREVRWQGRTWDHVQPKEQALADEINLRNGTTTVSRILRGKGLDPDEHFEEMAEEGKKLSDLGIQLQQKVQPDADTEDETTESD